MPSLFEMDIKVIDQFLDVAVHEKGGAKRVRGFIQAQAAFRNIYVLHFWAERGLLRLTFVPLLTYLSTISCSYALFFF